MTLQRIGWTLIILAAMAAGCQPTQQDRIRRAQQRIEQIPPPARQTVQRALQAIGGYQAWSRLSRLDAYAVISTFHPETGQYVLPGQLRIDLQQQALTAWGTTARGPWQIMVDLAGRRDHTGRGILPDQQEKVVDALATALHRYYGPLNLLTPGQRPTQTGPRTVGGVRTIRLAVPENPRQTQAYYLAEQTNLLRFVSAGADIPGEPGTVTTYRYQQIDQLQLPDLLEGREIGRHVLLGNQPVWRVVLSNIQLQ